MSQVNRHYTHMPTVADIGTHHVANVGRAERYVLHETCPASLKIAGLVAEDSLSNELIEEASIAEEFKIHCTNAGFRTLPARKHS